MKRHTNTPIIVASCLVLTLVLAIWSTVQAQTAKPANEKPMAEAKPMTMPDGKMMNMPDDMKQRCRMMMQTAIAPTDPAAILALKDDLKLAPDQVTKLQAIADKARQDAKGVLNEEQAKTVQAIPAQPDTSMAMHQKMMETMKKDMPAGQSGAQMPMMNCPMMNMMPAQTAPTPKP